MVSQNSMVSLRRISQEIGISLESDCAVAKGLNSSFASWNFDLQEIFRFEQVYKKKVRIVNESRVTFGNGCVFSGCS